MHLIVNPECKEVLDILREARKVSLEYLKKVVEGSGVDRVSKIQAATAVLSFQPFTYEIIGEQKSEL